MATETSGNDPLGLSGLLANMNWLPRGNYPAVSNAGMFPSPNSPYNSMSDQILDAFRLQRVLPGAPINRFSGYTAARYGFGNPGAGYTPPSYTSPGGGPGGTPTPPGGYAPGDPMQRGTPPVAPGTGGRGGAPIQPPPGSFQPIQPPGARSGGAAPAPTGGSYARSGLLSSGNVPGLNPFGFAGSQGSGGLAAWQDAQKYMPADEIARLSKGINAQGQFDPMQGTSSPYTAQNIANTFNSLAEDRRGDFVNSLMQLNGRQGVPANIGAIVQQALRDSMGKSAHDNWYAGIQNKQGSNIMSTAGLPSWAL